MAVDSKTEGKFLLKQKTLFKDVLNNRVKELPESDLCFQDDVAIYQFSFQKSPVDRKEIIEPGIFTLTEVSGQIILKKSELRTRNLLTSVANTQAIIDEANVFFNNLDVYDFLGEAKARKILLHSDPGMGKCLGLNTPILMFDGSIKMVQDIVVGDQLMGPDSTARNVLSTVSGREEMFKIIPTEGESFTANRSHILSLRLSGEDTIHNLSINDFLKLPSWKQERMKAWRTGVEFDSLDECLIDPYLLGLWLGDGSSNGPEITSADEEIKSYVSTYFNSLGLNVKEYSQNNGLVAIRGSSTLDGTKQSSNIFTRMLRNYSLINNKHIPLVYKTTSKENRFKLLAGLVDSDGHFDMGCFDFCQKSLLLANDIAYLARSLGMAAYTTEVQKSGTNSKNEHADTYYRVRISGNLQDVPVILSRKKPDIEQQTKNVLRTGISLESLGEGDYYGFTLDGDKLFLLGDFTVTHNTATITQYCLHSVEEDAGTVIMIWPTSEIESGDVLNFLSKTSEYNEKCTRLILVIEDIGGGEREGSSATRAVDSSLLDLLDGLQVAFKLPTLIIATTNYPQNLLSALADRPGRFDLIMALKSPSYKEKIALVEFIAKRELNQEEKDAFLSTDAAEFSVAHLKEIVIRSMLHKKSIPATVKEIVDHRKRFHKGFEGKDNKTGFNAGRDTDDEF